MPRSTGRHREIEKAQNEPTHRNDAGDSLTLRQRAAARLLAQGYPTIQIARHLGLNRHTISRWRHDPLFSGEIERLCQTMDDAIRTPGRNGVKA